MLAFSALILSSSALRADTLDRMARKLAGASKQMKHRKTAILPFPFQDGRDSTLSSQVAGLLGEKMAAQQKLQVVERASVERSVREMGLPPSGAMDLQSARQMAHMLSIEAVVTGLLVDSGRGDIEVSARLIRPDTGEILASAAGSVSRNLDKPRTPRRHKPVPENGFIKESAADDVMVSSGAEVSAEPPAPVAEKPAPEPEKAPVKPLPRARKVENFRLPGNQEIGPEDQYLVVSNFPPELRNTVEGKDVFEGFSMLRERDGVRAQGYFSLLDKRNKKRPELRAIIQLGTSLSLLQQGRDGQALSEASSVAAREDLPNISAAAHYVLAKYAENHGKDAKAVDHYVEVLRRTMFQTPLTRAVTDRLRSLQRLENGH